MKIKILKAEVCEANLELVCRGLVTGTWGNVSGIDRKKGLVAIKPSGVSYDELSPKNIVVVKLENGKVVEGDLNPSSDTATHLELYRAFPEIGGIAHTHSYFATSFAQAIREIPCLGTTHADYFYGPVPVTRKMKKSETEKDYELNTGKVIAEIWKGREDEIINTPAALVAQHGPFTWGKSAAGSVEAASVLEEVAKRAYATLTINSHIEPIEQHLLDRHFLRKHGKNAYYGQQK